MWIKGIHSLNELNYCITGMALAGLVADYTDSEASGGDEDEEAQHVKGELVTPKVSKAVTSKEKHRL